MGRVLPPGVQWPRLRHLGRRLAWAGLDVLLPPRCGGCGEVGARWCGGCDASLATLDSPLCPRCGYPRPAPELCPKCLEHRAPSPLLAVRSVAFFEGSLRNAIHKLKYRRDQGLADALAEPMARLFVRLDWRPTVLIPVPLSARRLAERGYNQADLLARGLAARVRLPLDARLLARVRETQSQTQLNARERRQNVDGAFAPRSPEALRGARALLVDDVHTTGATLEACARAALAGGAEAVWALTLGRAR